MSVKNAKQFLTKYKLIFYNKQVVKILCKKELAVALAAPVFAEKGDMEIVGKLGLNLIPKVDASGSLVDAGGFTPVEGKGDSDVNMSVLIGAEFFYYINKNVALGFGINNNFNADLKDMKDHGFDNKGEVGFYKFLFCRKAENRGGIQNI